MGSIGRSYSIVVVFVVDIHGYRGDASHMAEVLSSGPLAISQDQIALFKGLIANLTYSLFVIGHSELLSF
jgi:hypothetical protein